MPRCLKITVIAFFIILVLLSDAKASSSICKFEVYRPIQCQKNGFKLTAFDEVGRRISHHSGQIGGPFAQGPIRVISAGVTYIGCILYGTFINIAAWNMF